MKFLVAAFLGLILFIGCTEDHYVAEMDGYACDTSYYTREIKPIIVTNCTMSDCHNGEQSIPNYTNYLELKEDIEELEDGVPELIYRLQLPLSDPEHMPVDAALNPDELQKIVDWVNSGYIGC